MPLNPGNSAYASDAIPNMGDDDEPQYSSTAERLRAEGAKPYVPGGRGDRFSGIKSSRNEPSPTTGGNSGSVYNRGGFDRSLGRTVGRVYSEKEPEYPTEAHVTSAIANGTLKGNASEHYQNAINYQKYLKSTQQPFYKKSDSAPKPNPTMHIPGYAQRRVKEEEE